MNIHCKKRCPEIKSNLGFKIKYERQEFIRKQSRKRETGV